jgi:cytochrome c biogenesis protein CcmG, thiol:disulfide interchange protein DsbE
MSASVVGESVRTLRICCQRKRHRLNCTSARVSPTNSTINGGEYPVREVSVRVVWVALMGALFLTDAQAAEAPGLDLEARAGKVVVVDFWASWCAPCRQSIPWLNDMQAKYGGRGLVVIGVNVDTERPLAEKFLAQTPARFEIVYDAQGRLPQEYGVQGMPASFIFDRGGHLVEKHLGFKSADRDRYEQLLVKTLNGEK